jgi:hypothetical protein
MSKAAIAPATIALLALGGVAAYFLLTGKKANAGGGTTPTPMPEGSKPTLPGTPPSVEPPASTPVVSHFEGHDRFPRYSSARVATPGGMVVFEKEFDVDGAEEVRWISFHDPKFGTYKDIRALDSNHAVMQIYDRDGGVLYSAGMFTPYGARALQFPPTLMWTTLNLGMTLL